MPINEPACANCGSSRLLSGQEILQYGPNASWDSRAFELYTCLEHTERTHQKWIDGRNQSKMPFLVLAILAAPVFCYFHVWVMAVICSLGAIIGIFHERDAAFRDGVFCGTHKGVILSNLNAMVFCSECGFILGPSAVTPVAASPEVVEKLAEKAPFIFY